MFPAVTYTDNLSSLLQAFDAVFFIAANKDGYYFVAGTERRQHGVINGLCYIAVCLHNMAQNNMKLMYIYDVIKHYTSLGL